MSVPRSAIILAILLLAACAREERRPPAPPKIAFAATRHDFGRVEQGTRVRHSFHFVNQGEQDLSIDELRSACDCAATADGSRLVPPGGEGTIDVEFNTEDVFGAQRRTVTVYANDPENIFTVLTVSGEVILDVAADPPRLYVGRLHPGETFWREISVLVAESVDVLSVETEGTRISAKSEPLADGRRGRRIRIAVASGVAAGPLDETVLVRTSSARRPVVRIPVVGVVEGSVQNSEYRIQNPESGIQNSEAKGLKPELRWRNS
jgi:hypothetical protein